MRGHTIQGTQPSCRALAPEFGDLAGKSESIGRTAKGKRDGEDSMKCKRKVKWFEEKHVVKHSEGSRTQLDSHDGSVCRCDIVFV